MTGTLETLIREAISYSLNKRESKLESHFNFVSNYDYKVDEKINNLTNIELIQYFDEYLNSLKNPKINQ